MTASNSPFSFKGRLGQKLYWQLVGLILAVRIVAAVVVVFRPDWDFLLKTDVLILFIAILIGKRMKDFGLAPYWGWIGVFCISIVLPIVSLILWPPAKNARGLDLIQPWVGWVILALLLALIISVGLKKGDNGPNRYDEVSSSPAPPPLERDSLT